MGSPALKRSVPRLSLLFILALAAALLVALAGPARATATEPVFDSTYNTQLGNIVRITLSTGSDDYQALELESKRAKAGDIAARRIMGQLGRLRSEIEAAPPLRFLTLVHDSSGHASIGQQFDRASDSKWTNYSESFGPKSTSTYTTVVYEGRSATQALCTNSSSVDPGVPFHRVKANGICEVESEDDWNAPPSVDELQEILGTGAGIHEEYGGCAYFPFPYVVEASPCLATWIPSHDLWEMMETGNTQPLGSQTVDQVVPLSYYNTWSWSSAPPSQTDALTASRALLDDADYKLLRQWLNHRLDPEHYPEPISPRQTLGAGCDSNLAPIECGQARS